MPNIIGTSFIKPLAKTATMTVVIKVTIETSIAVSCEIAPFVFLPNAISTATGANPKPMMMITGPTTTGGKILSII